MIVEVRGSLWRDIAEANTDASWWIQEYSDLENEPLEGISIGPIDQDMFKWDIELSGPKGSPYAVRVPSTPRLVPQVLHLLDAHGPAELRGLSAVAARKLKV